MVSASLVQTLTLLPNALSILASLWATKCCLQTNQRPFGFKMITTLFITNLLYHIAMICFVFKTSDDLIYVFKILQIFSVLWAAAIALTIFRSFRKDGEEKAIDVPSFSFWNKFIPCLLLTLASEVLIAFSYIHPRLHYAILTLAPIATIIFLLQSKKLIKDKGESFTFAPIAELEALCLYSLSNLVTMGGFTVCADVIFFLGITNKVLLMVSIAGVVLGGLAGLTLCLVYMRQINLKKSPISASRDSERGSLLPF